MSVGKICDGGLFVGFTETKADVTDKRVGLSAVLCVSPAVYTFVNLD